MLVTSTLDQDNCGAMVLTYPMPGIEVKLRYWSIKKNNSRVILVRILLGQFYLQSGRIDRLNKNKMSKI
jgi:hypothetical protein